MGGAKGVECGVGVRDGVDAPKNGVRWKWSGELGLGREIEVKRWRLGIPGRGNGAGQFPTHVSLHGAQMAGKTDR